MRKLPLACVRDLLKDVAAARNFPKNTCPASRHVEMIGEALIKGERYAMLDEEPEHVGASLLATVAALYRARTRLAELEATAPAPPPQRG